jgi:hypothetical protein
MQAEIFLVRKKVDLMNEARFRELLDALDNLEVAKNRNKVTVEGMEKRALGLIRA